MPGNFRTMAISVVLAAVSIIGIGIQAMSAIRIKIGIMLIVVNYVEFGILAVFVTGKIKIPSLDLVAPVPMYSAIMP